MIDPIATVGDFGITPLVARQFLAEGRHALIRAGVPVDRAMLVEVCWGTKTAAKAPVANAILDLIKGWTK